jgi:hypothetical protein
LLVAGRGETFGAYVGGRSMDILLENGFRRTLAQVIVSALFVVISLPSLLLVILLVIQIFAPLSGPLGEFAANFVRAISAPVQDSAAQTTSVFVAILPAIVAVVCFDVATVEGKLQATTKLNRLGKVMLVGLILGAISSLMLLVVFKVDFSFVDRLSADKAVTTGAQLVVTGILSFQFLYIIKLFGIEDAVAGLKN